MSAIANHLRRLEDDVDARTTELELKRAEARQLQDKHAQLEREADKLADQLIRADEQFALHKSWIAHNLEVVLDHWGTAHPDGTPNAAPSYAGIAALERAAMDFPRVREHLVAKLNAAKAAFAKFEREHLK